MFYPLNDFHSPGSAVQSQRCNSHMEQFMRIKGFI